MKNKIIFALLVLALTACGPATVTAPTATASSTQTLFPSTTTPTSPATYPPVPSPTRFALPTIPTFSTFVPTETASPTETPLPQVLPKFPLDGYVILYNKNGDLYYQDGNNSPVKVTHVGNGHYNYMLSTDNQKIVLSIPSSYAYDSVGYSIKTDGTQEKSILPNGWPDRNLLWGTRLGGVEFVPGTHQLIIRTELCNSYDNPIRCVSSIFLTDTDTSQVKKLADLGFSGFNQSEVFEISPNGKMIALKTADYVEIIDTEGKVVRHEILPFKPNTPDILFPSVFWLPDSSGLIIALPNALFDAPAFNFVPAYTVWRYKIESDTATQISLDPPPMAFQDNTIKVSPDGKWIVYGAIGGGTSIYLANLSNGQVNTIEWIGQSSFSWSPDSRYFTVSGGGFVFGSVSDPVLKYPSNCFNWVDGNHLICPIPEENLNKLGIAEITSGGLKYYDLGLDPDVQLILFRPK